jgi:hypothetical protein
MPQDYLLVLAVTYAISAEASGAKPPHRFQPLENCSSIARFHSPREAMSGDSFFQKARKRLRGRVASGSAESKNSQDGYPGQAANAPVPCPEETSTASCPSVRQMTTGKPATPLPSHSPPAASDTRSHALPGAEGSQFLQSLRESYGEAEAETSHAIIGYGRAERDDDTQKSAAEGSLWDRAYDVLKDEKSDRIAQYEHLLSLVLVRGWYIGQIFILDWF